MGQAEREISEKRIDQRFYATDASPMVSTVESEIAAFLTTILRIGGSKRVPLCIVPILYFILYGQDLYQYGQDIRWDDYIYTTIWATCVYPRCDNR